MNIQTFDFSLNLLQALLWQHNRAANLQGLLQAKQAWFDENQQSFWESWVRDVFDLRTANDFGLSVWARILNIPLTLAPPPDGLTKPVWGFGANRKNFGNGNFSASTSVGLSTEQMRLVLRLRYYQLISRGTIPEINRIMADVFGDLGSVYVVDGLDMTMRYVFAFPLDYELRTVLENYDLLPRPAGVDVDFIVTADVDGYGFGVYHANFTNGNFYHA